MTDAARDSLRTRIESAERRNAERTLADNARAAAKTAADYTRAHPLMVIGGALAAGLAIGLLTRPGRRLAGRVVSGASGAVSGAASSASSAVKSVTSRGGLRIGTMVSEAAVAYIMTLVDDLLKAARTGQERVEDVADGLGSAAATQARKVKAGAEKAAGAAAGKSRVLASNTRAQAERAVKVIRRKTKG